MWSTRNHLLRRTEIVQDSHFATSSTWFHHLRIYEVSYLWFSPISCFVCFFVGALVSYPTGFQDPKKLNPILVSPKFAWLFAWWPRPVSNFFKDLGIGDEYVRVIGSTNSFNLIGSTIRTHLAQSSKYTK